MDIAKSFHDMDSGGIEGQVEEQGILLHGGFITSDKEGMMCSNCMIQVQGNFSTMSEEGLSKMHIMLSPFCTKVKELQLYQQMRPLNAQTSNIDARPVIKQISMVPQQVNYDPAFGEPLPNTGYFLPVETHPEFRDRTHRLDTFNNYNGHIHKDDFVEAGFYLNRPPNDKVTCFWCDGSLEGWNLGEIPEKEHVKYYSCCSYMRKIIGTDKIYQIVEGMTAAEREAAKNLRYEYRRHIFDYHYQAYNDINVRVRSLIAGSRSEDDAKYLASEGFHFDDETSSVECYYCGMHLDCNVYPSTVWESHRTMSPQCVMVRAENPSPGSRYNDHKEYLMCVPCGCFIQVHEYDVLEKTCPKFGCRKKVESIENYSSRRIRSIYTSSHQNSNNQV